MVIRKKSKKTLSENCLSWYTCRWIMKQTIIGFLVLCLFVPTPARARSPRRMAASSSPTPAQLFQDAKREYNLGNFHRAADLFEEVYRATGQPVMLYNAAQAHRQNGNNPKALTAYKAYLREKPDASNRKQVEEKIRELERPVQSAPPARTESDVVDPFPQVDPPKRRIQTIDGPLPVMVMNLPTQVESRPQPRPRGPGISTRSWVALGGTAVLAGAAVWSGMTANAFHDDLQSGCAKTATGCSDRDVGSLRSKALATNLLIGATGIAATAAGVFLYLDVSQKQKSAGLAFNF